MFLLILLALTTTVSMATPASTPSPSPVLGSLQPDQIRTVARENSQRIRDCWDAVPVDKRDIGKVIVRWVIDGTGHVTQAAPADESPTLPAGFGECLSAEIRRWTFPRPKGGGIVIVHYPFVFRATGGAPARRASAAADDIAAAIDASPDVARCFDELVTRVPDAHGLVSIRVVVGADGSVVRSRLVSSTRISPSCAMSR